MERPNTVAGLLEKRRELEAHLKVARAQIKTLTVGLDALDVALRLFGAVGIKTKPMRLPPAHPAAKGEFQRAALDLFRETGAPITSRMVADRFCEARGLSIDDTAFKAIRYRASSGLCNMRDQGMIRRVGAKKGANARWALAEGFDLDRARY
jgi:hypothetical protein